MTQALAVRLPRIRRIHMRPPSGWMIWFAIYGLLILNNIFRSVVGVLEGDWVMMGALLIWIALWFWVRSMYRHRRWMEETFSIPMQPPGAGMWVSLAAIWFINIAVWTI